MQKPATEPRPLCDFPSGTAVTVTAIEGGAKARCRLCAMGLTPGSQVVVGGSGCGGCCVRVRDTTITLGRGLAGKVLACPAGSAPRIAPQPDPCACKEIV